MAEGRYPAAAGTPLNPREWRRVQMEEQQRQEREAAQAQAQAQAQAEPQEAQEPQEGEQSQLSAEEREAIRKQQQYLPNGAGPGIGAAPQQPIQLPLQAPDGGPLRVAPELVAQARMLMIGAGIGGALVLIWWTRAQAQRAAVGVQVAEGESDK